MPRLTITNIGALYTLTGLDGTSGKAATAVAPYLGAELVIEDGEVAYAGPARQEPTAPKHSMGNPYPPAPEIRRPRSDVIEINAKGALVTPGLVDPHTHAVYGGDRASEMTLKLAGTPYLDILARGGGILSTVRSTRAASDDELYEASATRLLTMLRHGTTTVEVKSGYGLSTPEELRLLRIIEELGRELPLDVIPTFMGAHATPPEFQGDSEAYAEEVAGRMMPAVAKQGIARFCDVFCEPGVFSPSQTHAILGAAKSQSLLSKIHADEIETDAGSSSGAEVAADIGATSADHLRATNDKGFRRMAETGVIPVVLPATSFFLADHRYANTRRMIDECDLPVALATDDNPGTSPTESLQLVMVIAALELRMTPPEVLAGVTINAARAIEEHESAGTLDLGKRGDAVIWRAYDLDMLPYRFGVNQAAMVVKRGNIVI